MSPSVKKFCVIVAVGTLLGIGYGATAHKEPLNPSTLRSLAGEQSFQLDQRTKLSDCMMSGVYPDHKCTPGAIFESVTKDDVCRSGYSRSVRNVSAAKKESVYASYGIKTHAPGEYEIDHYISLELGGSNDSANLFPEPSDPKPGFHEKDEVENYLHGKVCDGSLSLRDAQILVSMHWIDVYNLLH